MPLILPGSFGALGAAAAGPWSAWDGTNDGPNQSIVNGINYFMYQLTLVDTDTVVMGALDFNQSPTRLVGHVLSVSGDTVTAGAAQNLSDAGTTATNNVDLAAVDSDTLLMMDRSGTTLRAQTVTRSGNTLTPNGSPTTIGGSSAFFPFILPYGNDQKGDGGDYHFAYRQGSSTVASEVRNVSGTTIGSLKASGSNGGASTSQVNYWGGNNGCNHNGSGGSIGGDRLAWYAGNGTAPDRLQFSTFDGVSTISTGTNYDPVANFPSTGSFGLSRVINDDTVQVFFYDGSDQRARTIGLTVNNVTSLNTSNVVDAGKRWSSSYAINTVDDETVICAEENINTSSREVRAMVLNWTDVNTPTIGTPVTIENTGSAGNGARMVKLDGNRHLVVWFDGTDIRARVMNRV